MTILSLLGHLIEICLYFLAALTVMTVLAGVVIFMVIALILSVGASWTYSLFPVSSKA